MQDNLVLNNVEVNWARAELVSNERVITLEPKLLAVLRCLVSANGAIVSQHDLLQQAWGDTIVSPNTIQRCITQLRKLFNDDAKRQRVIQTHPKLGYSLVLSSVKNTNPPKVEQALKPGKMQNVATAIIVSIGLLTLGFLLLTGTSGSTDIEIPELTKLAPITVHNEIVDSFVVGEDGSIYFAQRTPRGHLLQKQTQDGRQAPLLDKVTLFGELSLSDDQKHLIYGQLYKQNGSKCVDLIRLNLASLNHEVLDACNKTYYHSATWLDSNSLLYLATNKQHESQIKWLDLISKESRDVDISMANITSLDYDQKQQQLLVTGQSQLFVWQFFKSDKSFRLKYRHPLPITDNQESKARWYKSSLIAFGHRQAIYWYGPSGLLRTTPALNHANIEDIQAANGNTLLVQLELSDWSSRLRRLDEMEDRDIAATKFQELNGQFRPNSEQIAFVSNRSGTNRLYLARDTQVTPISAEHREVVNYLWALNGEGLVYLSEEKLWLNMLGIQEQSLALPFPVIDLFQSDGSNLLLSVKIDNEAVLIWYDFRTNLFDILLRQDAKWAQRIDERTLIANSKSGQLVKYRDGKRVENSGLPDITIQSRYLLRADELGNRNIYVQDKHQNIWRYDVDSDASDIIGRYDNDALFMTDFHLESNAMLSDNFVAQSKDLFLLSND